MSHSEQTSLADRMKSYESATTHRVVFKGQPMIARLDGKSFHTFTRGLQRPYDERLSQLMVQTTQALVEQFQAKVGYTQSDEMSLVWYIETNAEGEYPFGGRIQKMETLMAAFASVYFNRQLERFIPEKKEQAPIFDARVFGVPTLTEAYNCLLWRQQDCTKNAISMAAQSMFSHKALQGKSGVQMQEMMWKEKGVNFNDYPAFFKRGSFVRRIKGTRALTEQEQQNIPVQYRPVGEVTRSLIEQCDIWLSRQDAPLEVLFHGAPVKRL